MTCTQSEISDSQVKLHRAVSSPTDYRSRDPGFGSQPGPFLKIDCEIFSMVILPLPKIKEGLLSVTGKKYLH